jgi:hypothetical protein
MVVHQTEPAHGNSKDLIKFLQSILDPILTAWSRLIAHEMSPTNATRNTVITTTYGGINQSRTGDSHSKAPKRTIKSIRTTFHIQPARQSLCLSFFCLRLATKHNISPGQAQGISNPASLPRGGLFVS